MDADGETDHESVASVYPIQNTAESSVSTANTTTRGSTETTVVTHTPPVNKRQKPVSKGGFTSGVLGGASKDHISRSPSVPLPPHSPQNHSPSRVAAPAASLQPTTMPVNDRTPPTRKEPDNSSALSSPLTSPDMPLCDLPLLRPSSTAASSNTRPIKKRRLNRAYVDVPPLPPWRRRASYRPALALFEHTFAEEDIDMGEDYATGLGLVLNGVAALNERDVSVSTSPVKASSSGRPIRASRTRTRESLVREPPSTSTRGASISTSVSKKRGRPPAPKNNVKKMESAPPAEEKPAVERRSRRGAKVEAVETGNGKGKGKGKEKARDVDTEAGNPVGGVEEEHLPVEAEAEEYSDDNLEEEAEPHLPADNLELFLPSVQIRIGTYPQPADEVLHVAFQRLLIASKSSVWPPRSEQSVTSSLYQVESVIINPTTRSSPMPPSQPATSTTTQRLPTVDSSTSVPRRSPPPPTSTKVKTASKPVRPLPRLSHLKSVAPRSASSASPASSLPGTVKEPSTRSSKASSAARTPRIPSDVPPATATIATLPSTQTTLSSTSQPPLKPSPLSLCPPLRTDTGQAPPSTSPHPPRSDGRTDSQQSFDFTTLLADFEAQPAISPVSTSPSQSQSSFPGAVLPSPPGEFKTPQQILTHFGPGPKPISPSSSSSSRGSHCDGQQNAPAVAPHTTPPTPGDKFFRAVGYEGTEQQCGSFFPWVLGGSSEQQLDLGGASDTIDPSLLAGPPPDPQHPPSVSSQGSSPHSQSHASPVAGPSRITDVIDLTLEVSSQSSAQSHSPQTPQDLDLESESESESDPGGDAPLSMRLQRQFPALSKDLPAVEVEGRRPRRLTERALAMRHTLDINILGEDDEGLPRGSVSPGKSKKGAGKGKDKARDIDKTQVKSGIGKGKGKGKEKEKTGGAEEHQDGKAIRKLAAQPTFCHQCRNTSTREKMRCSTIRDSGDTCGLRYCSRCIERRYPDIVFEAYARHFICPRCQDTCNCTSCCSKRGETYISARVGKLPPPNSEEALALIKAAEENLKSDAPSRIVTRRMITSPAPKFDLVPGRFFGVIYGLEGERMGPGFMGEDNQRVLMNSQDTAGKAKGAARGPGRRKRRPPYGKVVAYIGKRRLLSRALIPPASASASLPPPASSSVSQDSQEATEAGDGQPSIPSASTPPVPEHESSLILLPHGRMYVGDRSVLDKGTYVSMDELILRAMREEEEDLVWGGPLSDPPSMDDQDEAVAPARPDVAHSTLDVQYAIAIAYHTLQGSPKDQAKITAAGAVRS
ncbi:hypothetical protein V8D89_009947 [Ganoderma adspersum]